MATTCVFLPSLTKAENTDKTYNRDIVVDMPTLNIFFIVVSNLFTHNSACQFPCKI